MSKLYPDIFISFSSKDEDLVALINKGLKQSGISTYFYPDDQKLSSKGLEDHLDEQLENCKLVIGVQSDDSLTSEWCRSEWRFGLRTSKLAFIRIKDLTKPLNFRYDDMYSEDFTKWGETFSEAKWQKFLEGVHEELEARRGDGEAAEQCGQTKAESVSAEESSPNLKARQSAEIIVLPLGQGDQLGPNTIQPNKYLNAPSQSEDGKSARLDEESLPTSSHTVDFGFSDKEWGTLDAGPLIARAIAKHTKDEIHLAARSGQADAQALLGLGLQSENAHFTRDFAAAGRWFGKASQQGFARASAELATLISSGRVPESKSDEIDRLLDEADDGVCVRAKTLKALLRLSGRRLSGVSYADISRLLEQANEAGDLLATTHLGWGLTQGYGMRPKARRGFALLKEAAQSQQPRAMAYLGYVYYQARGTSRNFDKAAHWFTQSARLGDRLGEYYYAWCHENGVGMARDALEARKLYEKSVARGQAGSAIRLAQMLIDGRGGVADYKEAARMLELASDVGEFEATAMARSMLGQLLYEGQGLEMDRSRAIELFELAAEDDEPQALLKLGIIYEDGVAVERDLAQAVNLYRRAAAQAPNRGFFRTVLKRLGALGEPVRRPGGRARD